MAYTNDYFELKISSTTYRFDMQLADSAHASRQQTSGFQRSWEGRLIEVVGPEIRTASGLVRVDSAPPTGMGSLANLLLCFQALNLEAKMYEDSAFWAARWVGAWEPTNLDPAGFHYIVPINLEQRT